MKIKKLIIASFIILSTLVLSGCTKNVVVQPETDGPTSPPSATPVGQPPASNS